MSDYYLQQVNFLDSESISKNCVTDVVHMHHDLLEIWNGYTCSYGNSHYSDKVTHRKDKKYTMEEIVQDCKEMYPILKEVANEDFEKAKIENLGRCLHHSESWTSTFLNVDQNQQKSPIYKKPIKIYPIEEPDLKSKIKHLYDLHVYDLVYHPDLRPVKPWWVENFEYLFPDHGGDEEAYYFSFGFKNPPKLVAETAYKMKKVWIVLVFDQRVYKITLGRTAHA
jgi:hypothetical protein